MDEKTKKVLNRLEAQCARKEYCSSEMLSKAEKLLDKEAAREVLESLVRDSYVSDARYAAAFAREKASLQGWGQVKIAYMLGMKGISKEIVGSALKEIDAGAAGRKLDSLLLSKSRQLSGDPQRRLKLIKYALSRGYAYDEVKEALGRIGSEPSGEEPFGGGTSVSETFSGGDTFGADE